MVYFPDSVMAELFGEKPHSLRECAENFLATEIYHLYRNDKESFKKIRECYIVASKDGIYEAINNLVVLYYSYGQDGVTRYVIDLLNKAISQGSKYAMINLFTILWTEEMYFYAIRLLTELAQKERTSLMCLYNLAVFYYWGKDFEHNTLKEDIQLAKKYLKRIIETAEIEILEDEEKKAFDAAKKLLSVLDKSD